MYKLNSSRTVSSNTVLLYSTVYVHFLASFFNNTILKKIFKLPQLNWYFDLTDEIYFDIVLWGMSISSRMAALNLGNQRIELEYPYMFSVINYVRKMK